MNSKKMLTAIFALVLTFSMAGCGSKSSGTASSGVSEDKPTDISVTTITFGGTPSNDLEGLQEIGKKLNVKLHINYIPANNIGEKLNALLASKDLTDVMFVEYLESAPAYLSAVQQGAFWDLTPYIKDYPNLSQYPESVWNNLKVDGKIMSLPRIRPLDGHMAMSIRQDWLDKLGLKAPTTMDELYNVMEAFTKNDPDGDGKANTYGLAFVGAPTGLMPMFGAGNGWTQDSSGKLIPDWWTPQFKEGMAFLNKAYKAGLILPDFPVMKSTQLKEMLLQSKAGIAVNNIIDSYNYSQDLQKVKPEAKLTAYELPKASDGASHYTQATGYYGQLLINKKVSEDKLKKILEVYDYTATQEGYNLVAYGIKDKDYTVSADGFITQKEESKKLYDNSSSWLSGYFNKYARAEEPGIPADIRDYNHKLVDSISQVSVADPTIGFSPSEVYLENGADWTKKKQDMMVNVILGKNTLDEWDTFVRSYQEDSKFKKYVDEINEQYK
ncbi:extracellular solute-binding protein [Paenibacillus sp. HJL G12]|uniref:Extracellular solute-binding protein n=2 Tax=Paenibacillus dendrobii TaxID=2691084 RepID=A0A7X3IF51_9BACL|nr:extracellular solute-binding protein [Paenibacillus dendrobii]